MPCASRDQMPLQEIVPGYSGRFADWGGITAAFESGKQGDVPPDLLEGLPDNRCQANHWGYLLTGHVVVDYGDRSEEIVAGQAYHIAPGHRITFLEDSDTVEFTPTEELERTLAAVRRNASRVDGS